MVSREGESLNYAAIVNHNFFLTVISVDVNEKLLSFTHLKLNFDHVKNINIDSILQVLTPSSGFLDFAISMRPQYHQAIIDTIRWYGWDKIIYLYDSHDGE